jgi:hypothetical protein
MTRVEIEQHPVVDTKAEWNRRALRHEAQHRVGAVAVFVDEQIAGLRFAVRAIG